MNSYGFKLGDIISVSRLLYHHYGVYAGNNRVIHYSSENGDFGKDICVREVDFQKFSNGGSCKVVKFDKNRIKLFSGKETVNRARSRMGEADYNLVFNNCEHFALWCKTGTNKSIQVENSVNSVILLGAVFALACIAESLDINN